MCGASGHARPLQKRERSYPCSLADPPSTAAGQAFPKQAAGRALPAAGPVRGAAEAAPGGKEGCARLLVVAAQAHDAAGVRNALEVRADHLRARGAPGLPALTLRNTLPSAGCGASAAQARRRPTPLPASRFALKSSDLQFGAALAVGGRQPAAGNR